jgi:hypothetical protein
MPTYCHSDRTDVTENDYNCGFDSKILTLTFLRGKCDEKLYRLNLALILIGQF